jgi:hypothetical protein
MSFGYEPERQKPRSFSSSLRLGISIVNRKKTIVYNDFSNVVNSIKIPVRIGRVVIDALIDTGAEISVISDNFLALLSPRYASCVRGDRCEVYSASNTVMISHGTFRIAFEILGGLSRYMEHEFLVIHNLRGGMILGLDFISRHGIIIDGRAKSITFLDSRIHKPVVAKVEIGPIIDEKPQQLFQLSHLPKDVEKDLLE